MTRRTFVAASCLAPAAARAATTPALNPDTLAKSVDHLPIPSVAKPIRSSPRGPYYRLAMRQAEIKLHRDLPATRLWCCGGSSPGPTIETHTGEGLSIEWANELPDRH